MANTSKISYGETKSSERVAITGMSGKFANSGNIYELRDNLFSKVDMVTGDFGKMQKHPELPKKTGKMAGIEEFDAGFFGVTSRQADNMDPLVRIVLEKTFETILDAGYHTSDFENTRTGVFAASSISESEKAVFFEIQDQSSDSITGTQRSMLAKRISYYLKLKGPSYHMDSACSSSLYVLEQAYRAIKDGKCVKAFVCGVNLCLHAITSLQFARLGVLSRNGSCVPFDDSASGYARSEGIVVILLEKVKDAKRIYAEVVHVKTNCDGFKKEGITFPSTEGQKDLMKDLYKECQVDPTSLTFMEAHCTGTIAGDPEELNTLDEVLCKNRDDPLHIGSIKSNLGHTEPATALCSIVKIITAMETGFLPPNINYCVPRKGVEGLEKGRMVVVTEKIPLPDQRGLFGINSFGFGGANAHGLLFWNTKAKVDNGRPKDDLPRLICVSGRVAEGVTEILNDFQRGCDFEFAYIIHQAFRKPIPNHMYRGYGIYGKYGEMCRSSRRLKIKKNELYIVFGSFEDDWFQIFRQLMAIPIFAKRIKSFQNMLIEAVNAQISQIMEFAVDKTVIDRILKTVIIQITLANILQEIRLSPNGIRGVGIGELVAAYLNRYLSLKQMTLELYNLAFNLSKNKNGSMAVIQNTWGKSMRPYEAKLGAYFGKYSPDTITTNRDVIFLTIGGSIPKNLADENITLINAKSKNCVVDLLSNLGRLYEYGFDMVLNNLYPKVALPVSRGTPMLSPLIKWNHTQTWKVHLEESEAETRRHYRTVHIAVKSEEWSFILGHTVDGRNLFPATGYLVLVWQTLSKILDKPMDEMRIVFENVKFFRGATVPKEGSLELLITIQMGIRVFEIAECGTTIVSGKIYEMSDEDVCMDLPITALDGKELVLTTEDVYKEFKLRGYQYSGKFKKIKKYYLEASQALVEWETNWISYLDCVLQTMLLWNDSRDLYLPTDIARLTIDGARHLEAANSSNNILRVYSSKELNIITTAGIEIKGVEAIFASRRRAPNPILEIAKFIPNQGEWDTQNIIRCYVQLILENVNITKVNVVEVCSEGQDENELLSPFIQVALDDIPLVFQDAVVLTNKPMYLPRISVQNKPLNVISNCSILVVSNLLEKLEVSTALEVIKETNGFIITRESSDSTLSRFTNSPFKVICSYNNKKEKLVLLRSITIDAKSKCFVDFSNVLVNLDWLRKLQNLLNYNKVVIFVQNEDFSGVLGFINCLRKEYNSSQISCVFIMDNAPQFNPQLEFYKLQLEKNIMINIWKNGAWGTYRHLPLLNTELVEREHCYINVLTAGDLSTATWFEGKLKANGQSVNREEDLVHIYYSALNFKDLMIASGRLVSDATRKDKLEQECALGFEFSGRNSNGERVMGVCTRGSLSTLIQSRVLLPIPDHWTMEDAATILVAYGTIIEALLRNFQPKPNESILIHSGSGGVGQAAINLCLYFGLTIFVTVGTPKKRAFIQRTYPSIKEDHIGNSRDTSFEQMVYQYTNARGVDYVLNSLTEEKLAASVRCLAKGGKFLEIGKFDLASNNEICLKLLEKDAEFLGLGIDKRVLGSDVASAAYRDKIMELINVGAIQPLPRTVFEREDIEGAFRYMATGKYLGKILIQMRNEEKQKVLCPLPKRLFKAVPRLYCKPECSYIICGGLGGFGLELADFLVFRGAKKLVLTSRSGVSGGYQRYRIKTWERYGVTVLTTVCDGSTEECCVELLKLSSQLGPVDGIFNLAAALKDCLFENQSSKDFEVPLISKAYCTKHLDAISRTLCPHLRYFVVFSSFSCGRGIAGQTNYGMANSIMERICEKRKKEGYPGLAIQWAAIGDVGVVAKMQGDGKELIIEGTLQQRISSCLEVLDNFFGQDEPVVASMLVADKRSGGKAKNLFNTILNIIGIRNLKFISMHSSFPELGVDSIMVVEIKQILEREYEIFMTAQDIRGMTLNKLEHLSTSRELELAKST